MTYLTIALRAFFSAETYRYIYDRWSGVGYMYLLVLVLFVTFISVLSTSLRVYDALMDDKQEGDFSIRAILYETADQLPLMTFKDGMLSMEAPSPHPLYVRFKGDEALLGYIDMHGDEALLEESEAIFLITQDRIITARSNGKYEYYKLDEITADGFPASMFNAEGELLITPDHMRIALDGTLRYIAERKLTILSVVVGFMTIMFGIFWFVIRIFISMIMALVMKLFAAIYKVKIPFDTGIRLSVIAMTPALLLQTLSSNIWRDADSFFILPGVGIAGGLYALLLLGYSFFAVRAVAQAPREDHDISTT